MSHTFCRKLEIGGLISVLARMVSEWSEDDDHLLHSSRLSALHGQTNFLSLQTSSYHWYSANKQGTDKILRINPQGKYTVAESSEFNLRKSGKSLKERVKERLAHRESPHSSSFDEYIRIRSSCWLLEERDGDYFCDCPVGMKVRSMLC